MLVELRNYRNNNFSSNNTGASTDQSKERMFE